VDRVPWASSPRPNRCAQSLVEDGYARREADPADGRVVRLSATAKGRRVMQQGRERRVASLASLLGRLPDAEIARIREAAGLVEKALSQKS
jgi:DNA-binding MarR family transcriptional regulator